MAILGNDWATQTNGTIQVTIVDNEVLIAGEQATDWTRSGSSRDAGGETRISFDFKADDNFNVHIRIDDVETAAFIDFYAWPGGPFSYAAPEDGSWPGWTAVDGSNMIAGEYNNLVLEQFGTEFMYTLNGVVISTITNAALTTIGGVLISCDSAAGTVGSLHIDNVQIGVVHVQTARDPSPENGAMHADTWVNLSWSPGNFAASHGVYFGEDFDDVDKGAGDSFRGNQADTNYIVGFPGFPYPEGLVPGTTYYWRVDEVNEADPNSPWRGDVWSFSIPPKTAYNPDPPEGAQFIDVDSRLRWTPGFGSVLSTVYIGTDYAEVDSAAGGVPQVPASYDPGTLELEKVYYWRVDAFEPPNTYKGDIWSFTTPGAVGNSQPANGAADVSMVATLSWTPADNAASSDLYFGTDADAVENATPTSPEYIGNKALGSESHDPGKLALGATYHWRVDAVYPADTVKGLLWSFTAADFIGVDDFESYNDVDPPDAASNRIFDIWIDGFGTTTNGALVGNDLPPYAEQIIVHGGAQSMAYRYDNTGKTSEATLTLVHPRDWTEEGATKLSLWFRGNSGNAADWMYVALDGVPVYHDDPAVTRTGSWTEWVIDLTRFTDQGVNLADVNTITIGIGTKGSPAAGGAGTMYFDDIRLIL